MKEQPQHHISYRTDRDPILKKLLIGAVERCTGARQLQSIYQEVLPRVQAGGHFWEETLQAMSLKVLLHGEEQLLQVAPSGGVLIIANHPFGVVDGLIASHVAFRLRSKFKILVNHVLTFEPQLQEYLLPIEFRDAREARRRNVQSRQAALEALSRGEAVILFPGGGVATRRFGIGSLEELPWGNLVAKLALQSNAQILPLYFHGENSLAFHLASQVHMNLRLALFIHETRKMIGRSVRADVRRVITPDELALFQNRGDIVSFLKSRTEGYEECA